MTVYSQCFRSLIVATFVLASANAFAQYGAYPGNCGDCSQGANGSGRGNGSFAAHREEYRQQLQQIDARNRAWWRPFNCWDAQAYNSAWTANLAAGLCETCTLRDCHFDPETGSLNNLGLTKLGEIVSNPNAPAVFVSSHFNPQNAQNRIEFVRSALQDRLGPNTPWNVVVSSQEPIRFSGSRTSDVNTAYQQQLQPPIIPISSGESVSSATAGN
jgi:hypothetical protein